MHHSIRLVHAPFHCPPLVPVLVRPNLGTVREPWIQLTSFFSRSFPSAVFKRFLTSKWHTFCYINAHFLITLFIGHIQEMPQLGWERLLRGGGRVRLHCKGVLCYVIEDFSR
jgi:hypothetical protein